MAKTGNPCRMCRFFGASIAKLSRLGCLCVKFNPLRFR